MRDNYAFISAIAKKHRLRRLKAQNTVKGVDTPLYEAIDEDKGHFTNWEQAYQKNIAKITTMILLFTFSNDDDRVSRKEFKLFKKFFKSKENLLTISDFKELKDLALKRLSVQSFIDYMYQNNYQEKIFLEAIVESKKLVHKHFKYISLIEDLENQYNNYNI